MTQACPMIKALHSTMATLILFVFGAPAAIAQQDLPKPLPRVLIIGDAVYKQHVRGAINELKDDVTVEFANWPGFVLPNSTNALEHLDLLLGFKDSAGNEVPEQKRPAWDLIHFNIGLGDLIYCVPDIKSHRTQPHDGGGVIRTSAKQYEKNLDTLVRLLSEKAPDAKLVWASTTPIRHSRENVFKPGDEIAYNQIAHRVMNKHGVAINDMHAYALSIMNMDKPAGHGVDPFFFDKQPLHPPVVEAICSALGVP